MSSIPAVGSTSSTSSATTNNALSGMNASDFLNLMIQQLQQQDPLNPTDSNQLLTQMSQIGSLQSNTQLQQTLTQMGLQQSIGASGNLIGKSVSGVSSAGTNVTGIVNSVKVVNQQVNLELSNGSEVPMTNVIGVTNGPTGAAALAANASQIPALQTLVAQNPNLAQLLGNSSGSSSTNVQALSSLATLLSSFGG